MRILILSLFLLFDLCISAQNTIDDWTLQKDENGIKVYSRRKADSEIKEIRSICYINSTLKSIVAVIDDWENYPNWVYQCISSSALKRTSETEGIHYQTVKVPWPAQNRDFVVSMKLTQDEKTNSVTIRSTCKPDYIPEVKDHVRITKLNACWVLNPQKDGSVQLINQIMVDPGGSIPAWMVNLAAVQGPYESMLKLKDMVEKKKYKETPIAFVKE